jgi:hypothetical protein
MNIQPNNNVFDQLTASRDYTRHTAELAAMMAYSSEQSFGWGWPRHCQAENGERTKNVALAPSSIHLAVESTGTLMEGLAFQRKEWPPVGKYKVGQRKPSPSPGVTAESIEITYRVALSLMDHEQIILARKALDALPVGQLGDPMIVKLRNMLALPVTKTSGKRDIDRTLDYQWIRDHAQDYRGQWVALDKGELLGAATSLRELLDRVKPAGSEHRPLLHQIS